MSEPINKLAVAALKAGVALSHEIIGIMDLPPALISELNRTATIANMRQRVAEITAFIDALERK